MRNLIKSNEHRGMYVVTNIGHTLSGFATWMFYRCQYREGISVGTTEQQQLEEQDELEETEVVIDDDM